MKTNYIKKIFILIIIFFSIYLYTRYINPNMLKVNEMAIINSKIPSEYNGLKIAHFSDLHYGRTIKENNLKRIIKELNNLNADIIIFTGDLYDNSKISEKDKKLLTKYLKKIDAKLFKIAVIGDYDKLYLSDYFNILENSNFEVLDNQAKLVYYESNTPINIIGLNDTKNIHTLYNDNFFNITLTHEPDNIKNIKKSNIVFAGHSLGGQIKLPFIGGIKKIKGAKTYYNDYYKIKDTELFISNGLGTQDVSLRLFNTPSITLYRLYNS